MRRFLMVLTAVVLMLVGAAAARATPYVGLATRACPAGGARVTWVDPDSLAGDLGLHVGYVLLSVNGCEVTGSSDVWDTLPGADGHVTVVVLGAGGQYLQYDADYVDPLMYTMSASPGARGSHHAHHLSAGAKGAHVRAKNVHCKALRR
jgi:hypothetical protein